ncbi:glycosyltransferase family 87 protein [Terriglobus aquaticus]|uniref:glycosyltransferase family 87 protein n=1 Tax=Terriglobus aquaticus TaxID=940139 RepID=UPI0031E0A3F9
MLLLFTLFGVVRHLHYTAIGEDLSSSYVGCRLLAEGQGSHLYSHDPQVFSKVLDPVWNETADRAQFAPLSRLHPYVQTPLWAWSLEPLCMHTTFPQFCDVFLVLVMLSLAGMIWLVVRYWAPSLFHPGWVALLCVAWILTEPFKYALFLTQTHPLYLFLTVLALVLARRGFPVWAGICLAVAAAVKITPAFLLLYWLMVRQRRAAVSFVAASAVLTILIVVTTGPSMFFMYLQELSWVSNVLLVAFNNQSLAAFLATVMHPELRNEVIDWRIHALAPWVKWISLLLSVGITVLGGWLDRRNGLIALRPHGESEPPPYGAVLAMLAATLLAPIAWSHYYIVLLVPAALLLDQRRAQRAPLYLACAAAIFVLNVYPVAYRAIANQASSFSILRAQFDAGLIAMGAMVLLSTQARAFDHARSSG